MNGDDTVTPAVGSGPQPLPEDGVAVEVPQRIFTLWLQGEDKAPPLVQMCLGRWRRLNPEYELVVLDAADAAEVLADFPLPPRALLHQALSDVLRIKLLSDRGGVWVDATAFPTRPLRSWLPTAAASGFFAFDGHRRPLDVDSWFLVAEPGNVVATAWWEAVVAYWSRPRELITFEGGGDWFTNYNLDPLSFFTDDEPASDGYPYYWFMYLFSHLLATRPDVRAAWESVPRASGAQSHAVDTASDADPGVSVAALVDVATTADVQKLSYKGPHVKTWLALDEAFAEIDRGHGADLAAYPVFVPEEKADPLSTRLRQAVPIGFRDAVTRALRPRGR